MKTLRPTELIDLAFEQMRQKARIRGEVLEKLLVAAHDALPNHRGAAATCQLEPCAKVRHVLELTDPDRHVELPPEWRP